MKKVQLVCAKAKMLNLFSLKILIFSLSNITILVLSQKLMIGGERTLLEQNHNLETMVNINDDTHGQQSLSSSTQAQLLSPHDDSEAEEKIPSELKANPNPLELPTNPEEVEIIKEIPLTLEDCIALAKANNRELKIAKLNLEKSLATLDEARAALFPNLSVGVLGIRNLDASGDFSSQVSKRATENTISDLETSIPLIETQLDALNNALNQPFDPTDPLQVQERIFLSIQQVNTEETLNNAKNALNTSRNALQDIKNYAGTFIDGAISLNYAIYSPSRQARIDFASEQVLFSELDVQRIEDEIILDVTLAYYDLQQADQQVKINENDVLDRTKRIEGLELQLEAALATRLDLLNAQVELDNAQQNLKNSQTTQQTVRRNLARLLNLPPSVTVVAADPIEIAASWEPSLEESIIMALKNRVELKQRLAQRQSFMAQREIALAEVKPTLGLFAEYQMLQAYTDDPRVNNLVAGNFSTGYAFGLEFNWNFFDGGAAQARAKQADAEIAIAEQEYANDANFIRFEVEQAYLQLPAQLENIATAEKAVQRAAEAVQAAQIRFNASVNTQTEVLDAQTRLVQAQNNLLNAVLGYNRARAELQRAVKN
jgi:outer membrane protein TolC